MVTPEVPRSHQEPTLVVDPHNAQHLVISYQDGLQKPLCGLATSSNGGATWTNRTVAGPGGDVSLPTGYDTCRDTALTFGADGSLYYVVQASDSNRFNVSTVALAVSRDGGTTFSPLAPVRPAPTNTTDLGYYQPAVAADPNTGRLHIAWLHYQQFSQNTVVETASTSDHGATFSAPVQVSPASQTKTGSVAVVASHGRVSIAWLDATAWIQAKGTGGSAPCPASGCPPFVAEVRSSTDAGSTFGPMVTVDDHIASGSNDPWRFSRLLTMSSRSGSNPLVMAWWEPASGLNRIVVSTSSNQGAGWSTPHTVAPPAARESDEQDRAMVAVAPDGRVDLAYADLTPADASGSRQQLVFAASSTDGAAHFSTPQQLTDAASNTAVGPARPPGGGQPPSDPSRAAWFGRHFGLDATDSSTLVAWTDSRRGTVADGRQDIVFARLAAAQATSGTSGAESGWPVSRTVLIVVLSVAVVVLIAISVFLVRRRRAAA